MPAGICHQGHEMTPENTYASVRADGRLKRQCKRCQREASTRYWARLTPEERAAKRKAFPSKSKAKHYQRKFRYGLTEERVREILAYQDDGCGICFSPIYLDTDDKNSKVAVDHDHATGEPRALLCQRCNTGLGMFLEDPVRLRNALAYVLMNEASRKVVA